jgi:hypothetical protein
MSKNLEKVLQLTARYDELISYFTYSCSANENNVGPNNSSLLSALLLEFRGSRKLRSYKLAWIKNEEEETHF